MNRDALKRQLVLWGTTIIGATLFLGIISSVQYIFVQHPKRWDITKSKEFTLAPQSKKVVLTLKEKGVPVEVLAFYRSGSLDERQDAKDLLDQYRDVDSGFKYTFIDPDRDPSKAKQNKVESYPTLVIKAGDKTEQITNADEESLTNALVKLLRTDVKRVYFLKGHGERSPLDTKPAGLSQAKEQIEKQNYEVSEILLLQEFDVPTDAAMLIIAGPQIDLMDVELERIRSHVAGGGKLLVLLDPFKAPKVAELLKEYAFQLSDDIVVDRASKVLGGNYLTPLITSYKPFAITKNFDLACIFPQARSVAISKDPVPKVVAKELALTSAMSWTITE
ncbi:GldG family protein, partial [Thermodesulfobacteriota bacterium]